MAAREKKTIDYFPHHAVDTELNDTLDLLDDEFKDRAYSFYYKMLEKFATTEGHVLDWNNPATRKSLAKRAKMNIKTAEKLLKRFAEVELIERNLWEKEAKIAQIKFLNDISDVYKRRKNGVPNTDYVGNMSANCTINNIKVKKTKLKERKENIILNTSSFSNFNIPLKNNEFYELPTEYVEDWIFKFPDVDVEKSLAQYVTFMKKLEDGNNVTIENVIPSIEKWLGNSFTKKKQPKKEAKPQPTESNIYIPPDLKIVKDG